MVATNLKSETMTLMDERNALEVEMNVIIERLSQPGGPGINGSLIDFAGFPRADIDIPTVLADRSRLVELRNDHKLITEKIEQNIQALHSARLAPRSPPLKDSGDVGGASSQNSSTGSVRTCASSNNILPGGATSVMDADVTATVPFALVDEIAEASPAAEDGLQLGDQIVKFGNVESGDNLLARLVSEAQTNQGCAVLIVLKRRGALINVTVTPRAWQGRGLLGCHFRILSLQ